MKKLCMFLALVLLFAVAVQAQPTWFLRVSGGVMGTTSEVQEGNIEGTAELSCLKPVYGETGNIVIAGSIQDIENAGEDWTNWSGKVYYFPVGMKKEVISSKPGSGGGIIEQHLTQPYIFTGVGGTHESGKDSFLEGSFNGGVGVMFPVMGANSMVEFGAYQMQDQWFFSFTGSLVIGMDF